MNRTLRRLIVLTSAILAGACSSPVGANDRQTDPGAHRLDTALPDSGAARGGGNLMGGN